MPKRRDVYESFLLQGLAPDMSYFTAIGLVYSVAKLTLGTVYYNDCSIEPRLLAYLLGSGSLLVLYLPAIASRGEKVFGAKIYLRLLTLIQFIGLLLGSCLLSSVYFAHLSREGEENQKTCNDVIFKFTASAIVLEWTYLVIMLLARGLITVVFNLIVITSKNVAQRLLGR